MAQANVDNASPPGPAITSPTDLGVLQAPLGNPTAGKLQVTLNDLPTAPGVSGSGTIWNNNGVPTIS